MAADRKPVTVHYRRYIVPATATSSLEEMVRQAMSMSIAPGVSIRDRYMQRLLVAGTDSYFINIYEENGPADSYIFGDMLHFTSGHLQALCKTADPNASAVPVAQMKAPAQSEYVHSQMFWMIRGNHAFVVQSLSLRTENLEAYLKWLLSTKATVLPAQEPIALAAKFDQSQIGGDLSDIREIVVGGVVSPPPLEAVQTQQVLEGATPVSETATEVVQHQNIDTGRTTGWDTARKILKELLGGEASVEQLMRSVPADAELNVQVHIGYKTKKRRIDRVALRQLETGLRNLPDGQLQVIARDGKMATDGKIRLQHPVQVRLIKAMDGDSEIIGNLLDPTDVLRAMREAYRTMVDNGKIED